MVNPTTSDAGSAKHHSTFDKAAFIASLPSPNTDRSVAKQLDANDTLAPLRNEYILPTMADIGVTATSSSSSSASSADPTPESLSEPALYLCGNSLGPLPKRSKQLLHEEIDVWGKRGVLGHFDHPLDRPWAKQDDQVRRLMSDIVGELTNQLTPSYANADLLIFLHLPRRQAD
jgi:kynureninase